MKDMVHFKVRLCISILPQHAILTGNSKCIIVKFFLELPRFYLILIANREQITPGTDSKVLP